jgi:hypothetical protein
MSTSSDSAGVVEGAKQSLMVDVDNGKKPSSLPGSCMEYDTLQEASSRRTITATSTEPSMRSRISIMGSDISKVGKNLGRRLSALTPRSPGGLPKNTSSGSGPALIRSKLRVHSGDTEVYSVGGKKRSNCRREERERNIAVLNRMTQPRPAVFVDEGNNPKLVSQVLS